MCAVYEEWLSEPLEFGTRKFVYVILWDTNLFALYTVIKKKLGTCKYMPVGMSILPAGADTCGYPTSEGMGMKFYPRV